MDLHILKGLEPRFSDLRILKELAHRASCYTINCTI
jgi:hypothetical protein